MKTPLHLNDAPPLPPLVGVSITAHPAFVWCRLTLGTLLGLAGLLGAAVRWTHAHSVAARLGVRLASVAILVSGAIVAVDSFQAV